MMLVGFVWAALAPLLLLVPFVILAWALRKYGAPWPRLGAAALTLVPVLAVHAADRAAFQEECRARTSAVITSRAVADGVLLTSGTANSFGYRYLNDEGFTWLEMRDIYRRDGFVRVTRTADGKIDEVKIPAPTARYEVIESHESLSSQTSFSTTRIVDRQTGAELARAGRGNFLGGRMSLVLGAWGSSSCNGAGGDGRDDGFSRYYHLARQTLRPPGEPARR